MPGVDLLAFFENTYYERLPAGQVRKLLAALGHFSAHWKAAGSNDVTFKLHAWAKYLYKKESGARQPDV